MKKKMALVLSVIMLFATIAGSIAPTVQATTTESSITLGDSEYKSLTLSDTVKNSEYVALTATVKASVAQKESWDNVMMLGIEAGNGDYYEFQLMYANASWNPVNLVKLGDKAAATAYEGDAIPQNQDLNLASMENVFSTNGLKIKMIRMERMVYLQAYLDNAWKMIGRMALPAGITTGIAFDNYKTPCEFTNIQVTSGKEETLKVFNGGDLEFGNAEAARYFPVQETHWQIDAKVVDLNKAAVDGEKRLMTVGEISVYYNWWDWFSQLTKDNWPLVGMKQELKDAIAADGLYVRYIRTGDKLRTYFSADKTRWIEGQERNGMGTKADAILLKSWQTERIEDFSITIGDSVKSDVSLFGRNDYQWFDGRGTDKADYNYVAATFTVKAQASLADKDIWRSIELGIGGGNPFRAFQLVYAPENFEPGKTKNLIKPSYQAEEDRKFETDTVPAEQWVDSKDLEAVFTDKGLQLKMIRLDGMAYLQANMNGQWKLIGRMPVPANISTDIAFSCWDGPCDIFDIDVQWGKKAALNAFNGVDFQQDGDWTEYRYFPVAESTWLVEGKVVDLNKAGTGEKRLMTVGGISLLHQPAGYWCSQQFYCGWGETAITGDLEAAIKGDGLYARYMREGDVVRTWFSADGINWVEGQSRSGMGDGFGPILLESFNAERIEDMKIYVGDDAILASKLKAIKVTTPPTKTKYAEGDKFDPTGMVVTAEYNDGSFAPLSAGQYTFSQEGLKIGTTEMIVSAVGKTATVPIKVSERYAIAIAIESEPENVYYVTDDIFDVSGAKLKVTYHNQTEESVPVTGNMCSGFDMSKVGTQVVTVTYEDDLTTTFKIHVLKRAEKGVALEDDGILPLLTEGGNEIQTPSSEKTSPKTADTAPIALYIVGMLCAVGFAGYVVKRKRFTES